MKTHPGKTPRVRTKENVTKRSPGSVAPPLPFTPNSEWPEKIPHQWAWHYRTLLHLRDRLLRSRTEHSAEALTPADMLGVDVVDTSGEQTDRNLLWAELGVEDDQLFEVDCALQRIRDGVYGMCEQTGLPIPLERLRAIPWTRYCRSAAEQHESLRGRKAGEASLSGERKFPSPAGDRPMPSSARASAPRCDHKEKTHHTGGGAV